MGSKANLFVISAPSGAGKTSLLKQLICDSVDIQTAISHTTRPKRSLEKEGIDYHFVHEKQFNTLINEGAFYEYAHVFGFLYGTSQASIQAQMNQGIDVILEIDWQGARQIKKQFPKSRSIFILPPSIETLESRLNHRQQDVEHIIQQRMNAAMNEISHYEEYDYLIINEQFSQALTELKYIIHAEKLKLAQQTQLHLPLLQRLLSNHQSME
jgi:guanylate kinase